MKHRKFTSSLAVMGTVLLFAGNLSAAPIVCLDTANSGSGGANASSSIDPISGGGVSASNCGPHPGNNKDITAALGGYGTNLSADGGSDGGWVRLGDTDGALGVITSFTGAGTTSGTFSYSGDAGADKYLIVLKFDGVYSTFETGRLANGWGWNTDYDGDGKFAVSHISIYGRGGDIPEPGPLALMAIGLLGVGLRRLKKAS